jgi:FtsZ-interacting cell division protein ZipA
MKKEVFMSSDLPSQANEKKNNHPVQPVRESEFKNSDLSSPVPAKDSKVLQIVANDLPNMPSSTVPAKGKKTKVRPVNRVTGEFLITNLNATQGNASVLFKFTKFS